MKTLAFDPDATSYEDALVKASQEDIGAISRGLSPRMVEDGISFDAYGFAVVEYSPLPEPEIPETPDIGGLKTAVYSQEGLGPSLARQLVRDYPEIMDGLNQEAWEFVHLGIASALQDEVINEDQYSLLISLMEQYNVPTP